MSQYPYSPPPNSPYGYSPQDSYQTLLAPAKRASIGMFLLAALMIPCGGLLGLASAVLAHVDSSELPAESAAQFQRIKEQWAAMGLTPSIILGFSIAVLVVGIVLLVLGIVVRRGGLASTVTSIIVCCLLGLFALLSVLSGGLAMSQGKAEGGLTVCIWGVLLALLIFILISLFQAARNSNQLNAYQMGYQAQFQQYQQQNYPPSQQPQNWQTPPQQWNQPAWPPTTQPPQPPQQQNWPPPPPPPPPSNPT